METALKQLGLNDKETIFYLHLLKEGDKTGPEIAKELGESRTNAYMILDKLLELGIVEVDETQPVRRYRVCSPSKLKNVVMQMQQEVKKAQMSLTGVLPELTSLFNLNQHKPGVVHFEGTEGFRSYQEDISRWQGRVCIFGNDVIHLHPEVLKILRQAENIRRSDATPRQMIFHKPAREYIDTKKFADRNYEIRFWGDKSLEGEIVIYGNKVAIVSYSPELIVTVLTNDIIANTFQAIFDQIWCGAEV